MEVSRIAWLALVVILFDDAETKVFTRCQLTRELLKNNFPRTFLSNWVCMIEQESDRNTSSFVAKTARRKYYGLFQVSDYGDYEEKKIGSEYCKEGKRGGKCDIKCEDLLTDDIKDDATCAMKVFEQEGFKYWSRWEARCKGQHLPDVEKCPDWQHPPTRVSPARDKRTLIRDRSPNYYNFYRMLPLMNHG